MPGRNRPHRPLKPPGTGRPVVVVSGGNIDIGQIVSNAIRNIESNKSHETSIIASNIRKQIQNLPELDTSLRSKPMVR